MLRLVREVCAPLVCLANTNDTGAQRSYGPQSKGAVGIGNPTPLTRHASIFPATCRSTFLQRTPFWVTGRPGEFYDAKPLTRGVSVGKSSAARGRAQAPMAFQGLLMSGKGTIRGKTKGVRATLQVISSAPVAAESELLKRLYQQERNQSIVGVIAWSPTEKPLPPNPPTCSLIYLCVVSEHLCPCHFACPY